VSELGEASARTLRESLETLEHGAITLRVFTRSLADIARLEDPLRGELISQLDQAALEHAAQAGEQWCFVGATRGRQAGTASARHSGQESRLDLSPCCPLADRSPVGHDP